MRVIIKENYKKLSRWVAEYIAGKINDYNPSDDDPFVLGLPTGSSPLGTYQELIELFKSGKVSFQHVVTFNMDEYVGLEHSHPQSYHHFMWSNFFDHVDVQEKNVHILNGLAEDLEKECIDYEKNINAYGGIDLFLGGIGPDGHIAFNEPGSSLTSRTRIKTLNYNTIKANSRFFRDDPEKVPKMALTVGVGTVMDAKEVLLIINGYNKARALREVLEGAISHMWTASMLQMHQHAVLACDDPSTLELKTETVQYFKDIEKIIEQEL